MPDMNERDETDELPLCCKRCGTGLEPGKGRFYVVRIETFADATLPSFSEGSLCCNAKAEPPTFPPPVPASKLFR